MKMIIKRLVSLYKIYNRKIYWRKINKHNDTSIGNVTNINSIIVGNFTYGVLNVIEYNTGNKLKIGHFCSIAPDVLFVLNGEHYSKNISTFPFRAHCIDNNICESFSKGDIIVSDDVWIGVGAKIMSGVHIGQGAIISAGAIVTKDVEPYSIVAGIPARTIKKRFSDDMIEVLLRIDYSKLTKNVIEENIDSLYTELKSTNQLRWILDL